MHLIFYSPQTLPSIGGLQYVVHYWAEALTKNGHTVTIITETPSPLRGIAGEWAETPLRLRVSACEPYKVLRRASFLQQLRAMRAADKILLFNVSLKAMPAVLLSGKPFYVTHHTALWYQRGPRPLRQRMKQWVANHLAKDNCACSGFIAAQYKKCRVIHSPYRADVFVPGNSRRIPGSILFAGRLVSDKGADLLIEAYAKLVQEGLDIRLTMVGDGPERDKLRALADKWGLMNVTSPEDVKEKPDEITLAKDANGLEVASPPRGSFGAERKEGTKFGRGAVIWSGALPQPLLVRHMQTHQVMVVPGRMEPMGMVVAEGLACGCRMVVSHQGGMPEVGGPFCRYFESENGSSLTDALRNALLAPLPFNQSDLQKHLDGFTIEYSVGELEKWLRNEE